MHKGSNGPARMATSPTGKPQHMGADYGTHARADNISGTPIAATNASRSVIDSKPGMKTSRMGTMKSITPPNRWEHSTHNPSGASNNGVEKQ